MGPLKCIPKSGLTVGDLGKFMKAHNLLLHENNFFVLLLLACSYKTNCVFNSKLPSRLFSSVAIHSL